MALDVSPLAEEATTIAEAFAKFAGNDVAKWQFAVGGRVCHAKFRWGRVTSAARSPSDTLTITISFHDDSKPHRDFLSTVFSDPSLILSMSLPNHTPEQVRKEVTDASHHVRAQRAEALRKYAEARARAEQERLRREQLEAEKREQEEREKRDRALFVKLKHRYYVPGDHSSSPMDRLFVVLLQLDDRQPLDEDDLAWLREKQVHGPVAAHYELMYELTGDAWHVVHASGSWRDARVPLRAIESASKVNERVWATDRKLSAALLTTKGGALRDLKLLDDAEKCAKDAVRLQPHRYYAFNLLGGISYDRGSFVEGDQYFQEARRRGATPRDEEQMLKSAIRKASAVDKRSIALHLISRDPDRFAWAKFYLR
jgi:tetratricopeptide (TPR) repeat protein